MPPELAAYITEYGYLTIFLLVFIQELGVPNPIPNELILLFAGYLVSTGTLNLTGAVFTAVLADVVGTVILYSVFYYYGKVIMKHVNRLLPSKKIKQLMNYLAKKGRFGIYVGRLLPLLRGYASVAAGLLRLPPSEFIPVVALSGLTWSGGYVILGYILGPQWQKVAHYFGFKNSLLILLSVALMYVFGTQLYNFIKRRFKL